MRAVDKTHTPYAITATPDPDPAKNDWNLGTGADPAPTTIKSEGYGTEATWSFDKLGLQSGHSYRIEFMVHDGDQSNTGGDAGEACLNVSIS